MYNVQSQHIYYNTYRKHASVPGFHGVVKSSGTGDFSESGQPLCNAFPLSHGRVTFSKVLLRLCKWYEMFTVFQTLIFENSVLAVYSSRGEGAPLHPSSPYDIL